jgi:16S rRNA (guanine1516-N2)-methyltransferase
MSMQQTMQMQTPRVIQHIAISFIDMSCFYAAAKLAERLNLPLLEPLTVIEERRQQVAQDFPLLLVVTPKRLELHQITKRTQPICIDFLSPAMCYRLQHGGGRRQLLAKAIGIKSGYIPCVLDVTAGLGKDAFVLAALGCKVQMVERSPIVGELLQNGLECLRASLGIGEAAAIGAEGRPADAQPLQSALYLKFLPKHLELTLAIADGCDFMRQLAAQQHQQCKSTLEEARVDDTINDNNDNAIRFPDVIYMDPMYPVEVASASGKYVACKKTALNKEEMRILKTIVGDDADARELFKCALALQPKRIVVKRPRHAPEIAVEAGIELTPSIVFHGSSCRYDVYLPSTVGAVAAAGSGPG